MRLSFTTLYLVLLSTFFFFNPFNFKNKASAQNNFVACGTQIGVWNYDTVFVECDIFIPQGEILSITEGTQVVFLDHFAIIVDGALHALGSDSAPVSFTIADTTGFGNIHSTDGGWAGIRFEPVFSRSDSSIFEHCHFSYGKAVVDSVFRYGGAVAVRDVNALRFSNCHFDNNYAFYRGGAIYAEKSDMRIEACLFTNNFAGNDTLIYGYGGAVKLVSGSAHILHTEFYNNISTGVGGALSVEFGNPLLQNCIFMDNSSYIGGAICYLRTTPSNINANILVANNYAETFGGGIACITAAPMFSNTTIANNDAAMGGGLYCSFEANPKLFNSIIWGNNTHGFVWGSQVWIWDTESEPGFYNCAIEYGVAEFGGSGNMFEGPYVDCHENDPLFIDPMQSDFSLPEGSPCVNAGMEDVSGMNLPPYDLAMNNRISGGQIDMGAYEFQEAVGVSGIYPENTVSAVRPLPLDNNTAIYFQLNSEGHIKLELRAANGQLVSVLELGILNTGNHVVGFQRLIDITSLNPGVYLLGVNTGKGMVYHKLIK